MSREIPFEAMKFFTDVGIDDDGQAYLIPVTNGVVLQRIERALMGDDRTEKSLNDARAAMHWILEQEKQS